MSRDMKPRRAPAQKKSAGNTLVGLFIGLVLGIVGAAAVVWYINSMPTPFREPPVQSPTAKPADGPAPLPGKPGDPVPEKRFQFYDILPGKSEANNVEPAPSAPETGREPAQDAARPAAGEAVREAIFLQAGSFQTPDDADNQKAKLAMLGLEAAIQQVMVQDKVWYRVRLGPYAKIEDVNKVRAELARQGVEAAVVRKD